MADKNMLVYDSANNKNVRLTGNASGQMEVDVKNTSLAVTNAGLTELAAAINGSNQMDCNVTNASLTVDGSGVTQPVSNAHLTSLGGAINASKVDVNVTNASLTVDNSGQTQPVSHTGLTELEQAINSSKLDINDKTASTVTADHNGAVATTEYTSAATIDISTSSTLTMFLSSTTSPSFTVQLQVSPDNGTTWFNLHEEVVSAAANTIHIKDCGGCTDARIRIPANAGNTGNLSAWLSINRY